jgi:hypothetical protein
MMTPPDDPRLDALVLDLVEWVAGAPRHYAEVMDAWRTTCPKLAVWEEAVGRGFLVQEAISGAGVLVKATQHGRRFLASQRPQSSVVAISATATRARAEGIAAREG